MTRSSEIEFIENINYDNTINNKVSNENENLTTPSSYSPFKSDISSNKMFSSDTDEEEGDDDVETPSIFGAANLHFIEGTTSATEWIGITTNSEECSYSSEIENSDSQLEYSENGGIEYDITPSVILNPSCGANDRSK